MSQTILIEPNDELRKIFSLNLNTYAGTDVIERKNSEEAIDLLKILPNINLIITRNRHAEDMSALKLFQFIEAELLDIPMIVIGDEPQLADKVMIFKEPFTWETLIKGAARFLGVTPEDLSKRARPDFVPVTLSYFYDITETPCDVFIRIRKSATESQYVKRIHSKDIFDYAAIKKYEEGGLKEFYVSKDYQQYFVTFVTNSLIRKLESNDLNNEERILTTAHSFDVVADQIQNIGLDQTSIELADIGINSMMKTVQDAPQLADLLKFLFSNKISYAFQHANLISVICQYILSKQSWAQPKHLEILSFVAFFSDITLKSEAQIRVNSMDELNSSNFSLEEKDEVLYHAKNACDLLDLHPKMNEYVKTVLLQHHGKHDGIGFAQDPGEDLHPLSKVFIVADSFVKILLSPNMPSFKKDILPILYQRLSNPSYQKIIKALELKFQ
jgi:HD-GYP domain-containing protein (c-di-GMP phosphodiesterase class II)